MGGVYADAGEIVVRGVLDSGWDAREAFNPIDLSHSWLYEANFRPRGGLGGPVRETLRWTFMRALPKIKFPSNAAGLSQAEFGRLVGFRQSDAWRPISQSEINAAIDRLRAAGVVRQDVVNAADFYSYNAFRDIGNEAAAFRSYYLQQIARGW